MKMTSNKFKRSISLLACSASVAFSPAQANCLSLGEIDSSQLVAFTLWTLQPSSLLDTESPIHLILISSSEYFLDKLCKHKLYQGQCMWSNKIYLNIRIRKWGNILCTFLSLCGGGVGYDGSRGLTYCLSCEAKFGWDNNFIGMHEHWRYCSAWSQSESKAKGLVWTKKEH